MSGSPVSGSGREGELLLIALANFSESCTPPELTPACPFFELTPTGPQCGEQCMDMLAQNGGVPNHKPALVNLDEYEVRPIIPVVRRRDFSPPTVAFDAGEIEIADADKPTSERRTVALIRDLRRQLLTPPHLSDDLQDRAYRAKANWDELERRGVPVDDLVRKGLHYSLGLIAAAFALFGDGSGDAEFEDDRQAWRQALVDAKLIDDAAPAEALDGTTLLAVSTYFAGATRDEIINMSVPSPERLGAEPDFDAAGAMQAQWIHDRFAQTYISDWSRTSQALEWRYVHGKVQGCCPPATMKERYIPAEDLHADLSEAGCASLLDEAPPGAAAQLHANNFTRIAADHLRDRNFSAAATLFKALVELDPTDKTALNNLGFCLIPTDLQAALGYLEQASDELTVQPVNIANRALVLHMLGRDAEALELAGTGLELCGPTVGPAWVWLHDGQEDLELTTQPVPLPVYLADLITHIDDATRTEPGK